MNKTITSTFLTALLVSAFSAAAATTPENTDDASALGTSDTPQIKQQDKRIDKKSSNKSMKKNSQMSSSDEEMKMMDDNNDGMVSRVEYMNHHETRYGNMPQNESGGVSYRSSMNNKPIGTTSGKSKNGSVDVTRESPADGRSYGTN